MVPVTGAKWFRKIKKSALARKKEVEARIVPEDCW
jgi:hypothetical protein